jgi:hypothetical protein
MVELPAKRANPHEKDERKAACARAEKMPYIDFAWHF